MKSIWHRVAKVSHGLANIFIGLVFFSVGIGLFAYLTVIPCFAWFAARDWVPVPCTILRSEVMEGTSSDGTTYSARVSYTYEWEHESIHGDRIARWNRSYSEREDAVAITNVYPAASQQTCFVNPDRPDEAVLNRDFNLFYLMGCFGLIFVGSVVVEFISRWRKRPGESLSVRAQPQPVAAPVDARRGESFKLSGRWTLKKLDEDVAKGAVLWGVAVFCALGVIHWQGKFLEGVLSFLLVSPFLLIGLYRIGEFGFPYLYVFYSKPELWLSPTYLRIGEAGTLECRLNGKTQQSSRLRITLRGEEIATYGQGTSAVTERSVFERIVLLDTRETDEIAQNDLRIVVPEFTVPTFVAQNNQILWKVEVDGVTPWWPDWQSEFDITIAPLLQENRAEELMAAYRESY